MTTEPQSKKTKEKTETVAKEKEVIKVANAGFAEGFEKGFKTGLDSRIDLKSIRQVAFDNGVRHIVTLGEEFLAKELRLPSREALANSGKIPAWWIATLVTEFQEAKLNQKVEGEKDNE